MKPAMIAAIKIRCRAAMDRRTKRWKAGVLALTAGAALCAGAVWALQSDLAVTNYELPLPEGLRELDGLKIAQISDVHSADIQEELRTALREAAPDLIVFTGDLVNREDRDLSRALSLAAMAAQIAPAYYAPGNHEADNPCYPELREGLEKAGVTVLEDQSSQLRHGGKLVNVIGLLDLSFSTEGREKAREQTAGKVKKLSVNGALNVVLSHRPSLMEEYADSGADLVFSGHAHGGQVRLPLVGGLYAPGQGVLPELTEGIHTAEGTTLVVSRGLGNSVFPLRLFNRPEVAVVTLHRA